MSHVAVKIMALLLMAPSRVNLPAEIHGKHMESLRRTLGQHFSSNPSEKKLRKKLLSKKKTACSWNSGCSHSSLRIKQSFKDSHFLSKTRKRLFGGVGLFCIACRVRWHWQSQTIFTLVTTSSGSGSSVAFLLAVDGISGS